MPRHAPTVDAKKVPGRRVADRFDGSIIASLLAILLVFAIHAMYLRGIAEDAFISFRFAQHLADGHGLVWNIGERPVEGYTNFLWVVLCAGALRAGLDVVLVSQLLGILASVVTIVGTFVIAHTVIGLPRHLALLPALLLALAGPFAAWATSGMETSLFGMLLLLSGGLLAAWARSRALAQLVAASVTMLLATLTRPEGALATFVFAIAVTVLVWRRGGGGWRELLPVGVYVVPFGVYMLWRYDYFGFWLPNTFYAKTGGSIYQYLRGAKYVGLFMLHYVLLPFAPLLLAWRCGWGGRGPGPPRDALFGLWLCGALCAAFGVYLVYVGGDYMAMYRFIVPLLPFVYLLLTVPLWGMLGSHASFRAQIATAMLVIVAVGLTVVHSTPMEARLFPKPEFMHGTYRGVEYERRYVARFTVIGRFFGQYKCHDSDSIALEPIGAIPYYSRLVTHSAHGIVDPVIAHKTFLDRTLGLGFPGHEKIDWLHAISKKPTYILFSRQLRSEPEPFPSYPDPIDALVRQSYRLQSAWLDDASNRESGYLTFLELGDARDMDCRSAPPSNRDRQPR